MEYSDMTTSKKTAAKQVEAAVAAGKESVDAAVKVGTDAFAKGYESAVTSTKEQVDAAVKAGADAFQGYEDVVSFGKDNVDAVMEFSTILAKGVQEFNKVWFDLAQASVDKNAAASKALLGCKSAKDLAQVQSDQLAGNYGTLVLDGRKLSDMSVKLAEEVAKPVNDRVNAAMDRMSKPVAA